MFKKLAELREEREEGFTLIELLVVILIIGILSAIAIPVFLNQRKTAVDAAVKSDVKNAATAAETFAVKSQGAVTPLPSDAAGLNSAVSDGVTLDIKGDTNTYCITGVHANGDESSVENGGFIYAPADGGFKTEGTRSADGTYLPAGAGAGSGEVISAEGTFGIGQSHAFPAGFLYEQVVRDGYWDNGSNNVAVNASFKNIDADTMELTLAFPNGVGPASGLSLSGYAMASETDRATYGNDKGYSPNAVIATEIAPGVYNLEFPGGDLANANEIGISLNANNGEVKSTGGGFSQTPNPSYVGFEGHFSLYIG